MSDEQLDLIAGLIRGAVRDGLKDAVHDPNFWHVAWDSGAKILEARAKQKAGSWLLGSIGAALSKLLFLVFIGLGVYLLGGWTMLLAFFKTLLNPS